LIVVWEKLGTRLTAKLLVREVWGAVRPSQSERTCSLDASCLKVPRPKVWFTMYD